MSIISDNTILQLVKEQEMINPFVDKQVRYDSKGDKIISYGNSSYGYDARVSNEFKIFLHSVLS